MSKDMWLGWSAYIKEMYSSSSVLRNYIEINNGKYQKQFLELLDE